MWKPATFDVQNVRVTLGGVGGLGGVIVSLALTPWANKSRLTGKPFGTGIDADASPLALVRPSGKRRNGDARPSVTEPNGPNWRDVVPCVAPTVRNANAPLSCPSK